MAGGFGMGYDEEVLERPNPTGRKRPSVKRPQVSLSSVNLQRLQKSFDGSKAGAAAGEQGARVSPPPIVPSSHPAVRKRAAEPVPVPRPTKQQKQHKKQVQQALEWAENPHPRQVEYHADMHSFGVYARLGLEDVSVRADPSTGGKKNLLSRDSRITGMSWSRGEVAILAFTRANRMLYLADARERGIFHEISFEQRLALTALEYTPHPACILLGTNECQGATVVRHGVPLIYDVQHNSDVMAFSTPEADDRETSRVPCLAVSPTSDNFLACFANGGVGMYDLRDPQAIYEVERPGSQPAGPEGNIACWDASGTTFACTAGPHKVNLFDMRMSNRHTRCASMKQSFCEHGSVGEEDIISLAFQPGPECGIAVKRALGSVWVMKDIPSSGFQVMEARRVLSECDGDDARLYQYSNVAYTPTGVLCTGNPNGTITHWSDLDDEGLLLDDSVRHSAPVGPIAWHPECQIGASASYTVNLWGCPVTSTEISL